MKYETEQHTFVICAYQDSPYIEQRIDSLLCQTAKSHIIMILSTPGDYVSEMVDKYGLVLYINTGEKGISGDWNFAYNQAIRR